MVANIFLLLLLPFSVLGWRVECGASRDLDDVFEAVVKAGSGLNTKCENLSVKEDRFLVRIKVDCTYKVASAADI